MNDKYLMGCIMFFLTTYRVRGSLADGVLPTGSQVQSSREKTAADAVAEGEKGRGSDPVFSEEELEATGVSLCWALNEDRFPRHGLESRSVLKKHAEPTYLDIKCCIMNSDLEYVAEMVPPGALLLYRRLGSP